MGNRNLIKIHQLIEVWKCCCFFCHYFFNAITLCVHANILVFLSMHKCVSQWNKMKWKMVKKNKRPAPFTMPVVYCILFICLKWIRKRINSNVHNTLHMWMKYIYYSVNATRSRSHLSIANSDSESDLHRMVPFSFCFYSNSFG